MHLTLLSPSAHLHPCDLLSSEPRDRGTEAQSCGCAHPKLIPLSTRPRRELEEVCWMILGFAHHSLGAQEHTAA